MKQRKAKTGGLEKAPTRGREQGKRTFLVLLQMVQESKKGREESERHLGKMLVSKLFKTMLVRTGRRGCFLVLVSRPPPQETSLCFYGDFSFLVLGEVPFSAFTTPFSW